MAEKFSKKVLQIYKNTNEVIKVWKSIRDIEREKGFNNSSISRCCTGKLESAYGYKLQFADKKETA